MAPLWATGCRTLAASFPLPRLVDREVLPVSVASGLPLAPSNPGNLPMTIKFALAFSGAALLLQPALALDTPPPQNAVEHFVLDNGLEVVVIPDHRAPVVTHMVWYKVGSADEPAGKSGIAHFFEHLMFKATSNHEAGEFDAAISAIGGNNNAFTSYDYTCFYEIVPPEALEEMMRFEADRMRNLVLDDRTIATEREVVLEERR